MLIIAAPTSLTRSIEFQRLQALEHFTARAVALLKARGLNPVRSDGGSQIAWRDNGGLRTLMVATYGEWSSHVVRLAFDVYPCPLSRDQAEGLDVDWEGYAEAIPFQPKGELSVLPDEVDAALEWALTCESREQLPPRPPFEVSHRWHEWPYLWSKRAAYVAAKAVRAASC